MEFIISLIMLSLLIIFTIKNIKEKRLMNTKKFIIILYVISIIIFIALFATDYHYFVKDRIIYSLAIALITIPITLQNINNITIDEKMSRIKTIITNKINEKQLNNFKRSHIKVVLITNEENKLGLKETNLDEISSKILKKTTYIKSKKMDILDEYISNTVLKKSSNLNGVYNEIIDNRMKEDNYLKSIKFILLIYIPLILSTIIFKIYRITSPLTLLMVIMIKYISVISTRYIINKNKDTYDIKLNKPKPYHKYLTKQEIFIVIIQSLICYAFLLTPYLYMLLIGASERIINSFYLVIYFYMLIFSLISCITEKPIIYNIFNKRVLLMSLILIGITILINNLNIFANSPITIRNYIPCVIIAFVSILFLEYTKFARFISVKRRRKRELKNYKKHQRSKSNNA